MLDFRLLPRCPLPGFFASYVGRSLGMSRGQSIGLIFNGPAVHASCFKRLRYTPNITV